MLVCGYLANIIDIIYLDAPPPSANSIVKWRFGLQISPTKHVKILVVTVAELLGGGGPRNNVHISIVAMFAKAPEVKWERAETSELQTASASEPMYQISLSALSLLENGASGRGQHWGAALVFGCYSFGSTVQGWCLQQVLACIKKSPWQWQGPQFFSVSEEVGRVRQRVREWANSLVGVSQRPRRHQPTQTSLPSFRHFRPCILQITYEKWNATGTLPCSCSHIFLEEIFVLKITEVMFFRMGWRIKWHPTPGL